MYKYWLYTYKTEAQASNQFALGVKLVFQTPEHET